MTNNAQDVAAQNQQRRLSKEELLKPKVVEEAVFIESLDGEIIIRSLTVGKRKHIREKCKWGTKEFDQELSEVLTIVHSVVEPQLTEDDVRALQEQDARIIDEISIQIQFINLTGKARDLKKESGKTPNLDSA